jgi:membrane fusion protein, adhesin transport system
LARLHAEVYEVPLKFPNELHEYRDYIRNQSDLYVKRQTAFREDIRAQEKLLDLAKKELSLNESLLARGDISRSEILRLEKTVADIQAQIANKRNKYFQDCQAEMTKAQEELSTQTEQLRDRSQILQHTTLYAPVDGLINSIKATTLGAVVRPGETVLEITPTSDDLVVEVKVAPSDIAFIAVGQYASVKLDAYDSSIYGGLSGEVSYISPDTLVEDTKQGTHSYYRVVVAVKSREFKGPKSELIRLRPGLSASVEIKAMDRTILSYLTKPITKTISKSMGEP